VQAWIASGRVTVNGATVQRAAARAALGDVIAIAVPDPSPHEPMRADPLALDVIFEDEHLLAVDKPAGIVVHPTFGHARGTLMNALLWRAREWPRAQRPSIVSRLDKLTSGVVVVAKTAAAHAALQRALTVDGRARPRARITKGGSEATPAKEYLAIVYGKVRPAQGTIDVRLRLDPRDRRQVVASGEHGAQAVTRFERVAVVRAPRAGLSLVRCSLVTGRRHQIRVHLAARGWPIVGDPRYGEPRWRLVEDPMLQAALRAFPRQALHASRVAFVHPFTGEPIAIGAPIPPDIRELMKIAGLDDA
jgi:23S rRNA pseudouridine1911/1915/1917 synthase